MICTESRELWEAEGDGGWFLMLEWLDKNNALGCSDRGPSDAVFNPLASTDSRCMWKYSWARQKRPAPGGSEAEAWIGFQGSGGEASSGISFRRRVSERASQAPKRMLSNGSFGLAHQICDEDDDGGHGRATAAAIPESARNTDVVAGDDDLASGQHGSIR
ncbi:hypothetical protein B0I35DRAFT_413401 [Stachybotrys elegans]|uniref:Uncharacterized protein n=1 Tax=Stachybotrys elegans TaxID=80388 RepID=A0A8K0SH54_9HYPO|nr:hypothetical protein B0I35DRAFT_413401 [Stachybotrys elegans]